MPLISPTLSPAWIAHVEAAWNIIREAGLVKPGASPDLSTLRAYVPPALSADLVPGLEPKDDVSNLSGDAPKPPPGSRFTSISKSYIKDAAAAIANEITINEESPCWCYRPDPVERRVEHLGRIMHGTLPILITPIVPSASQLFAEVMNGSGRSPKVAIIDAILQPIAPFTPLHGWMLVGAALHADSLFVCDLQRPKTA